MRALLAVGLVLALSSCGGSPFPPPEPTPTPPPSTTLPGEPTPTPEPSGTPEPAPGSYACSQGAAGYNPVPNPVTDSEGRVLVEVHLSQVGMRSLTTTGQTLTGAAEALGLEQAEAVPGVGFRGYLDRISGQAMALTAARYTAQSGEQVTLDVEAVHEIGMKSVEPIRTNAVSGVSRAWDLLNQRGGSLDGNDDRPIPLKPVHVYLIDTRQNDQDPELRGKYGESWAYHGGSPFGGNDHGSACAALVAGVTAGGAVNVVLHAVQVLDNNGSGRDDWVRDGIRWAWQHAQSHGWSDTALISMSLGGGNSNLINLEACAADAAGLWVFAAAGNSGPSVLACTQSPARVAAAWTVGAIDYGRRRSSFSSPGVCVDVHAPGEQVDSGISGWHSWAGTSAATPLMAAIAAHFRARGASKAEFYASFTRDALSDTRAAPNTLGYLVP